MRITANQVTSVRLLLLPLPVAMVYRGGVAWLLGALGVYILLGLTDALDGYLARRHGGTPLGELLDPIVDKIFLVASFVPLADLGVVSMGLVSVIFAREIVVTLLRSIAAEERASFRTSLVAKLKTTVQMAGAGFVLLVWLFPEPRVIRPILGVFAIGSLVPVLLALARRRRPGWRATWGAVLIVAVAAFRFALEREVALRVLMFVIVGFTMVSGLEYLWSLRNLVARRLARSAVEGLRLAGLAVAIPLLLLSTVPGRSLAITLLVMCVAAAELAVGGLDNSLARAGRGRAPLADLARSAVQLAAAAGVLLLPAGNPSVPLLLALTLAATLADLLVRALRHRDAFGAV